MKLTLRLVILAMAGVLLLTGADSALAQNYPTKPIRLIVPFPPGGASDIQGRMLGQKLAEALGQQVVVDNRPGASSILAAEITAKAPPDGYTLFLAAHTTLCTNVSLYSKLSYNPTKDFAPVTMLCSNPNILVVHPSVPANSVKELIALAKSKPGQLNFASAGIGTSQHLAGELFKTMAGVDMVHIPYKGSGQAVIDLLSGQVSVMFDSISAALPNIKAGKLRTLAVAGSKRWPLMPDLPTISESGLPGYDVGGWNGIVTPAGTPKAIITKLNTEIVKIMKNPAFQDRLLALGAEAIPSTPEQMAAIIKADIDKYAKIVKDSGAKVD